MLGKLKGAMLCPTQCIKYCGLATRLGWFYSLGNWLCLIVASALLISTAMAARLTAPRPSSNASPEARTEGSVDCDMGGPVQAYMEGRSHFIFAGIEQHAPFRSLQNSEPCSMEPFSRKQCLSHGNAGICFVCLAMPCISCLPSCLFIEGCSRTRAGRALHSIAICPCGYLI